MTGPSGGPRPDLAPAPMYQPVSWPRPPSAGCPSQQRQVLGVLRQSPVAHLGVANTRFTFRKGCSTLALNPPTSALSGSSVSPDASPPAFHPTPQSSAPACGLPDTQRRTTSVSHRRQQPVRLGHVVDIGRRGAQLSRRNPLRCAPSSHATGSPSSSASSSPARFLVRRRTGVQMLPQPHEGQSIEQPFRSCSKVASFRMVVFRNVTDGLV